jgi:hypothetical protein
MDSHFEFRNDAGETIPAFGTIRLTGVAVLEPGRVVLTAARPNTFGCQFQCALNGPVPIAAGALGTCTRGLFMPALYETTDGVPASGEQWGPRDGGFKLRKHTGGFSVVGVTKSAAGLVLVSPVPMRSFVGKTDAAHAKGATGTISIYSGGLGSETDTTLNMTGVYNRFADVSSGKWVRCQWTGQGNEWELIAAEC